MLPDIYEHPPQEARGRLSARSACSPEGGLVLLTAPTPGHQAALRRPGKGLQPVDEEVSLPDLVRSPRRTRS